ncbi:hypothetical protein N9383_02170 [Granulosicoccus sp.]|nr:hypothetical protein [Granulosicoccus sp.]
MALINRRTGIAGITAGALLCLICGIPFIAALLGVGGISFGAILADLPTELKVAVTIGSLSILALSFVLFARRRCKPTKEMDQ